MIRISQPATITDTILGGSVQLSLAPEGEMSTIDGMFIVSLDDAHRRGLVALCHMQRPRSYRARAWLAIARFALRRLQNTSESV